MARRRYLVTYDIRDDKRLRAVAACVETYGDRVQYSVFVCDLSDLELVRLRTALETLIMPTRDSIMVVYLGTDDGSQFTFLGQRIRLPDHQEALII